VSLEGEIRTVIEGSANPAAPGSLGDEIYAFIADLFPICRSITGNGFRDTITRIGKHIPLEVREVPTGTPVLDWTVPKEWNIADAYIQNSAGERVVDFQRSNLHVLNYSVPVRRGISLSELKEHLFTLPEHPDWIPYRTSYYSPSWGFCLSQRQLETLSDGEYEIGIDSSLEDGFLTYGECYLEGETSDEILISSHACHPSLANDNLSGVAVATFLARHLATLRRRYSYRFLFIPGTIGSITWLARNEERASRIKHGLVLAGLGDRGRSTYKKSRRGDAEIDRAAMHVLRHRGDHDVQDFEPYGYDERQYCSPGFDLPVGCLMRTPHGRYPEYHTSADDLTFVGATFLEDSFLKCLSILEVLERNRTFINLNPRGEPQLGRRGLYASIGGGTERKRNEMALLWVLNLSDGKHSLLDIADRADLVFDVVRAAADHLVEHGLLREVDPLEGEVS
jgi:aminopeptidase-like protein